MAGVHVSLGIVDVIHDLLLVLLELLVLFGPLGLAVCEGFGHLAWLFLLLGFGEVGVVDDGWIGVF